MKNTKKKKPGKITSKDDFEPQRMTDKQYQEYLNFMNSVRMRDYVLFNMKQ